MTSQFYVYKQELCFLLILWIKIWERGAKSFKTQECLRPKAGTHAPRKECTVFGSEFAGKRGVACTWGANPLGEHDI